MHMSEHIESLGKEYTGTKESEVYLVELESGLRAVFRPREDAEVDLAAYIFSEFLGKRFVPPVVMRSDVVHERWSEARSGSLQLFIEHDPRFNDDDFKENFYENLDPFVRSDIDLFLGAFGQFDNHLGNLEFDVAGAPLLFDFETARIQQKVQWGDYPFVKYWKKVSSRENEEGDFPFSNPHQLKNPSEKELRRALAPFKVGEEHLRGLLNRLKGIPNRTINYVIWKNNLWFQCRVRARRPFIVTSFNPETISAARLITPRLLNSRMPEIFRGPLAFGMWERLQLYLRAAREN